MREIGGRNGRLAAASPSARFARGFFSSISDTVSIGRLLCRLGSCQPLAAGSGCARAFGLQRRDIERDALAGASTLALFASLRFGSGAALADAVAAALTGLRAVAGLRAAVLVVVFVGILVPENSSWLADQRQTSLLRGRGLLMNGLMDFTRLRFIHRKNLDQVFDRRVAQSFEIGEAGFHEQQRLLFGDRQRTAQSLRRLRDFCSTACVAEVSRSMLISQPVSREVNRAFWPFLPMASES